MKENDNMYLTISIASTINDASDKQIIDEIIVNGELGNFLIIFLELLGVKRRQSNLKYDYFVNSVNFNTKELKFIFNNSNHDMQQFACFIKATIDRLKAFSIS